MLLPTPCLTFWFTFLWSLLLSLSLLQALRLFRLTAELESRAAALRLEALQHMTVAMAGVDCRELFSLMTAFFGQGTNFANDPFNFLDGAPSIRPPLDLTDTDSDREEEKAGKSDQPASASVPAASEVAPSASQGPVDILEPRDPPVKSKPKVQYADKVPSLAQTRGFFPADPDSLHNTGILPNYHVKRAGSSKKGRSIYVCPYESECSTPPYTGDIASAGSHVRRHHLGHSVVCPYCGLCFYNAAGWKVHMLSKHAGMPLYGSEVSPMVHPVHIPPVSVAVPAVDVDPEDTLPHVPDVADNEEDEAPTEVSASGPTSSAVNPPAKGIDSYSIKDIQYRMQFLPSDLRRYEYFGGGSWLGCYRKDDSQTDLFAAKLVAQTADEEALNPPQDEDEEHLVCKRRKHDMHLFHQEHYGKIWHPDDDADADGGTSTV